MRCQSCGCDVPPAFVHAIASNICAGCGGPIMDEQSVELMKGLASAMEQMPHDPQGIAGWLLSNYRLEKVGDGEPTGFHRGKKYSPDDVDYSTDKQNKLNRFFERANAPMDVVGARRKDILKRNNQQEEDIIEEQDEINESSDMIDPRYKDVNPSDVLSSEELAAIEKRASKRAQRATQPFQTAAAPVGMPEEYSSLPNDDNMSPQLRALQEKQMQKIVQARENVTSGVRTNVNGFSRGG